ncbi:MAG: S9 family peptidase [Trueperaceae bacterium]|nr:S9 family peptidase [Trueperaceae bacterium]
MRAAPDGRTALMVAGAPTRPDALLRVDLHTGAHQELATAGPLPVDAAYLSEPETLTFPSTEGRTVHAHLYRPANPDHAAPEGTRPPLLVNAHGGPTSSARLGLDLKIHYWTSRGFAYLDVDYGGSGGYGRAYRQALEGRWGEVDVDDCGAAARALVARGEVDPDRLAIRGGSAGGYTTLAALAFRDVFHAGVSYYGVSDLEMLAQETHKFESRYFEGLVGPYPEAQPIYRARSPLHHVSGITRPVLFLQGEDDAVVPPNQAEMMVDALRAAGVPVAYLSFEGEAHGFRRADTIRAALEAEASFYAQVFGLEPADAVAPLRVDGL